MSLNKEANQSKRAIGTLLHRTMRKNKKKEAFVLIHPFNELLQDIWRDGNGVIFL